MKHSPIARFPRGLCIWPGMIFVLIGLNVCIVALTVYFAHSDGSFAIESDYYQKAIAWNQTAQQTQRNRELGWNHTLRVDVGVDSSRRNIVLRIEDAGRRSIEQALVSVNAFPSVRASERQELTLPEGSPGEYRGELSNVRPGLWEFRLVIRRGDDIFTASIEQMIDPVGEGR